MKRTLVLLLFLVSSTALADCYIRSNIKLSKAAIQAGPTDLQRLPAPDPAGAKCLVRYRVYINNEWVTAEGSAVAKTENEACAKAVDVGRGYVLAEVQPNLVSSDSQMVCSDLPDIKVRPVRRGEYVWESETDLHSSPLERSNPYFYWKQAKCRKFIERRALHQNLIIYQGVICQAATTENSKWLVLDKY